jgi:hypothetical protein
LEDSHRRAPPSARTLMMDVIRIELLPVRGGKTPVMSGRRPVVKGHFEDTVNVSGAVMSSAF